jgi:hypothetical protein
MLKWEGNKRARKDCTVLSPMQESFLSEYHYEEKLDEDNARNLLSFGDDYRWEFFVFLLTIHYPEKFFL